MEFTLNGNKCRVPCDSGTSLLEVLRVHCGISSTKDGCQPQATCGCCLALIDGRARVTCSIAPQRAAGKEIITLEGIPEAERRQISQAFVAAAGLQCGFCIPGIALRAKFLLDRNPTPSRTEIAQALDGHLCRCTGYVKIIDAIELLGEVKRGERELAVCDNGKVGESLGRFEGEALVLGDRPYIDDMSRPGMLHGAVLFSHHARARVKGIDTSAAASHPGVKAVVTAADVPGNRWYGLIVKDWPGFVAIGEEVRCVGDMLAAVAADDERTARRALELIRVEYEPLEPVVDPVAAMQADAPQVNPKHENVLSHTRVSRGDAEKALAESAHVVTDTWHTQRIEHLFLEPESTLVEPLPEGRLHLFTGGQGIFDDRRQVASFLGISEEQIFVELVPNGGAFGGKEDLSIQAHTALLAQVTGRPVKVTLTREESIRLHPKRHPLSLTYTVGCDGEGKLTAVKARIIGDTGAYASVGGKVLERAAGHACGPYRVDNVDVESVAVYTNNPPCGAMRGFGANQAHFAIEGCLDLLAKAAGIDRWQMRWINALEVGDVFSTGQVLEKSVGIKKTLQAVKEIYDQAVAEGHAVGIGCGLKNSGIGNGAIEYGKARLVVEKDGSISLFNGYTEMGQGLNTVLIQCAVEVTGIPAARFQARVDSTYALDCGQTTGSRGTLFGGRAVRSAAEKLRADLEGAELKDLTGNVYEADVVVDDTTALSNPTMGKPTKKIKTHTTFGYATQVCILDDEGRIERFVAAHDVGRAINPALCEGQIEGSIHMGLGYALTEDFPCPGGKPSSYRLRDMGVLRARDMPEVEVILVEDPEPEGPFGAKGVGEIGLVPTAAAVASALEAFDGVRRTVLPMRDSPAAQGLSRGKRPTVRKLR
ncbi:MAG: selenium-dependent xanthine dehydrogenase [Planctomycetota bacterium]